jgi:formylglycine-generating enzyme required for sulfatase activity/energy-coupling factor transporter ATP-binding protein EcfA2
MVQNQAPSTAGSHVGGDVEMTDSTFAGRDLTQYDFTFQIAPFQPPPDLAKLRAAYADYLFSAHRHLDFKGVPQVEKVAALLPLEAVFVPLHARLTAPEADTWRRLRLAGREMGDLEDDLRLEGMVAPAESAAPMPIDKALNKEDALVILGDPGAGKSTLLKHLALHLARDEDGPLPILLPLNAYAEALQREEICLQTYLADYYAARRKDLAGVETLFDRALGEGQAVVLLDGLDEVQDRRQYVNQLVEDFVDAHVGREGNRFVVTSRIVGYRDAPLSGARWPVYTLTDWGREEIEHFAARWTLAFEIATHGDTPKARADAEEERQDLLASIPPGSGIERLASNPLLLTIMALIKRQRVTLPHERVKLYELYLETLISAWNKARALDKRPVGPEVSYLETVQVLAPLALWLREESPTAGLVSREQIERWLTDYYQREWGEPPGKARRSAREFLEGVRNYSNLLVERGQGRYGFLHLTFEEMLAAKGIALLESRKGFEQMMEMVCRHWLEPAWRETLLLTVGVFGIVKQDPFRAGQMLRRLCAGNLADDNRGWNVVLAGEALVDVREVGVDRRSAEVVTERLVETMQDREVLAPTRRDAGHLLGRLGWEPEGGLDVYVPIPPGPFLYGDDEEERMIEEPYYIGAYPVTNKQYARFVEAGGYEKRAYWSDEGWSWRTGAYDSKAPDGLQEWLSKRPPDERDRPFYWSDKVFSNPLCPVVGVSWFEAEAYCNWLTTMSRAAGCKLQIWRDGRRETMTLEPGTLSARLPTEEEWERAVRGADGREYPWGDEWDRRCLNCAEWWARRELPQYDDWDKWWKSEERKESNPTLTAMGAFPNGVNAAGLWAGAGNVWEWTGSWYREGETRMLRGGSWFDFRRNARCAYRYHTPPDFFIILVGFRVVFPGSRLVGS